MKVFELLESDEWENIEFHNSLSEIKHLESKRKALFHQRNIIMFKIKQMVDKGIAINDSKVNNGGYVLLAGTGSFETDYKRYWVKADNPQAEKIKIDLSRIETNLRQYAERIKNITVKGHSFCFTGFRNVEWEHKIIKLGGTMKSSVVKDLTFLVALNPNEQTGKMLKAKHQGTKIMSKEELRTILRD